MVRTFKITHKVRTFKNGRGAVLYTFVNILSHIHNHFGSGGLFTVELGLNGAIRVVIVLP